MVAGLQAEHHRMFQTGLRTLVYLFERFKRWNFGNHFYEQERCEVFEGR